MPTIPPLPQTMIPALPFVALIVTDWLHHSMLPRWLNVLIGLLVPLALAVAWSLLSNALTPNLGGDIVLLAALCYAVMALPDIAPLRAWLQSSLTSPAVLLASHHREIATWSGPPAYNFDPEAIDIRGVVSRQPLDTTLRPMPPVLPTDAMPIVRASHITRPMPPISDEQPGQ